MKKISELMKLEHSYLDSVWRDFLSEKSNKEKSKKILEKFSSGLLNHIRFEDEVLAPIFSKHLGITKKEGPSNVMYHDHSNIIRLLDKIKIDSDSSDVKKYEYDLIHFRRALTKHHEREEILHYPLFDNFISSKDWKEISNGRKSI